MKDLRQLDVWKKGHQLTLEIYDATQGFPRDELYGLTRQLLGAAASIPTNIAEGCGRTQKDSGRFLTISMGSAHELEYLLLLARDLSFLTASSYDPLNARTLEVKKMLFALIRSIRRPRLQSPEP